MRIFSKSGGLPTPWVEVRHDKFYAGTFHDVEGFIGDSNINHGWLDPKCAPWNLTILRTEFIDYVAEAGLKFRKISTISTKIAYEGLPYGNFIENGLRMSIARLGSAICSVTTTCECEDPLSLHTETWDALIGGYWKPSS